MNLKRKAEKLALKYGTRNPFEIAEALGYIVIYVPLQGIRGFYQQIKRCTIIYIDVSLSYMEAEFVCAHELGHILLHRGCNRIFMDNNTYFKVDAYEIEADRFAVNLLYTDDDVILFFSFPVQMMADDLGISTELAEYRLNTVTFDDALWNRLSQQEGG